MNIKVYDVATGQVVCELMSASTNDILQFIHKGFKVVDTLTKSTLTEADVLAMTGVSDCVINS